VILFHVSQVSNPLSATFAKVTPTVHNGSTELVIVHKRSISNIKSKIWIEFQKVCCN